MSTTEKRREQWRAARTHYRNQRDLVRGDMHLTTPAAKALAQQAAALQMTQKDYIEYLILEAAPSWDYNSPQRVQSGPQTMPRTQLEEITALSNFNEKQSRQLTFDEALQIIKKQAFWLDRYHKLNEVHVKRRT